MFLVIIFHDIKFSYFYSIDDLIHILVLVANYHLH